jgi:hypothetical protein
MDMDMDGRMDGWMDLWMEMQGMDEMEEDEGIIGIDETPTNQQ